MFFKAVAETIALILLGSLPAAGVTFKTLADFQGPDGGHPTDSLVLDDKGSLYGTTLWGGANGHGIAYRLTPPAVEASAWTKATLFSFGRSDGAYPSGSLIADETGNLYGVTLLGGAHKYGTIFKLSPPTAGKSSWTATTLYSNGWAHGVTLNGRLTIDATGNLYGAIDSIGAPDYVSSIFKLKPAAAPNAGWSATTIVRFDSTDAANPNGALVFDARGAILGTTILGGAAQVGTVFKLTPPAAGKTTWLRTTLVDFNNTNGAYPNGGITLDDKGNIYGTTSEGGARGGYGSVYKLTPPAAGVTGWTLQTLVSFDKICGAYPSGSLVFDAKGNLYGTTSMGGAKMGHGTVFKLSPPIAGENAWVLTTLVTFHEADGAYPTGSLALDTKGNFYGTTFRGGKKDLGTVFMLRP